MSKYAPVRYFEVDEVDAARKIEVDVRDLLWFGTMSCRRVYWFVGCKKLRRFLSTDVRAI